MPKRDIIFVPNHYYHIYNRSTGAVSIFGGRKNADRFLTLLDYYRYPQSIKFSKFHTLSHDLRETYESAFRKNLPLVEIHAFAIMTNHYHLLIRQTTDESIAKFIANIQNSFAKYFNTRNERPGGVFQGPFRAKRVEREELLLHISRYIHLNPVTSYTIEIDQLSNYRLTSFPYYLKSRSDKDDLVKTSVITALAGSKEKYKNFVYDQSGYQRELKKIAGLIIEK